MSRTTTISLVILSLIAAGLGYALWAFKNHSFSAREEPSRIEAWLARHARQIATPADARNLKNPYHATEDSLTSARHHFVEHCSACHAIDGSGNTVFGRNMYPQAPDLRDQETQKLTDGEIYYIISNGVRLTGMPAFGGEDSPEEIWKLVLFIRRLPNLTPEELKAMEGMGAGATGGEAGQKKARSHTHGPGSKPHKD